jgi:DNA modification methylase
MTPALLHANSLRMPVASNSVACVVTSPPYWGLRKYSGTQSLVWGGVEGCAHEWDTETRKRDNRYTAGLSKDFDTHTGAGGKFSEKQEFSSSTCLRCGAFT